MSPIDPSSLVDLQPLHDPLQRRPERRVSSAELLGDRSELLIEHAGRVYRLRITQNGKLILTA